MTKLIYDTILQERLNVLALKVGDLKKRIHRAAAINKKEPFVTVDDREKLAQALDLRRPLRKSK